MFSKGGRERRAGGDGRLLQRTGIFGCPGGNEGYFFAHLARITYLRLQAHTLKMVS